MTGAIQRSISRINACLTDLSKVSHKNLKYLINLHLTAFISQSGIQGILVTTKSMGQPEMEQPSSPNVQGKYHKMILVFLGRTHEKILLSAKIQDMVFRGHQMP
jgi:hypothetical protein